MRRWMMLPAVVATLVASGGARQAPQSAPTQAQQRPVFRAGAHFVRVDAYPIEDGRIVEGLKPDDFEIFEDGKPQAIESLDYIKFDTFTPEAERRNPSSQREGFEWAADPRYRVFVILIDMAFSNGKGVYEPINDLGRIQSPLVNFINRIIGTDDLFGLLSTRNTVKDLVLGQKTTVTVEQIRDLWRASVVDQDPTERYDECITCPPNVSPQECKRLKEALKARYHADQTFTLLRELVAQLGAVREERKNVVFVSDLLPQWRADLAMMNRLQAALPKAGIDNGRVGLGDPRKTPITDYGCAADVNRLPTMDFEKRFQQVLTEARQANVAFYPITPSGLQAPQLGDQRILAAANDGLRLLARETGGIAIVDSNDLNAGMRRIADDLQAYYVLGYYTTNTKFDGGVRRISVKMKGAPIRARREYRAPTPAEIAALASASSKGSPAAEGPPEVIGEPVAYRVGLRQVPQKVSLLEFVRADRIRVQWPVLAALDRREARLLDSAGKPLPIDLPVSEDDITHAVVVEVPLAPFGRGVYSIELTAGSGARTERRRLTFMMK